MANKKTGLARLVAACRYSMLGLSAAFRHEEAFRMELALCLMLVPAAFWVGDTALERVLLVACLFLVLIVEVINSAIEAVVDRIGEDIHELAGRAKDMGSAAVFLSMTLTVVVWGWLWIAD